MFTPSLWSDEPSQGGTRDGIMLKHPLAEVLRSAWAHEAPTQRRELDPGVHARSDGHPATYANVHRHARYPIFLSAPVSAAATPP